MSIDISLIQLLAREAQLYPQHLKTSDKSTQYSGVAMIFKVIQKQIEHFNRFRLSPQNLERAPFQLLDQLQQTDSSILFMQRAFNQKDMFRGQISLPGGKSEPNENDLQASIRETYEELGLNLYEYQTLYLGKNASDIYVMMRNQKKLYAATHLFLIITEQEPQLTLNILEVNDAKWIPFSRFYHNTSENIQIFDRQSRFAKGNPYQYLPCPINMILKRKLQNYQLGFEAFQYDINLNEVPLWGVTFYSVAHTLAMVIISFYRQNILDPSLKSAINQMLQIVQACLYFRVNFIHSTTKQISTDTIDLILCKLFKNRYIRKRSYIVNYLNVLTKPKL